MPARGLILAPALPMPSSSAFHEIEDAVTVQAPDGTTREWQARVGPAHFHLVGGGSQWSIVVRLLDASKDDVPVGSRVLASEQLLASISSCGELR